MSWVKAIGKTKEEEKIRKKFARWRDGWRIEEGTIAREERERGRSRER
jgi:hypothetical protein